MTTVSPLRDWIVHFAATKLAAGFGVAVRNSCEMLLVSSLRNHSKNPTFLPADTDVDDAPESGCGPALSVP